MRFVDTNVLLYAISRSPAEQDKAKRANDILTERDLALSVQVLQEFYVQATRATRPFPLPHEIAVGLLTAWTRFKVQELTLSILTGALQIKGVHGFSYWDSAIVAAARALGCRILYSEDMSHGREVEGVTIVDPFR